MSELTLFLIEKTNEQDPMHIIKQDADEEGRKKSS